MNKTVKRIISLVLSLALCSSLMLPAAAASADAEKKAAALKKLGLFMGVSDTEFELYRAPTRVEALVMLLRTLGKEKEAKASSAVHPFTDVPEWANKHVAYAYEKGLTKGVSATSFGAGDASSDMYLTFILRALGYSDAAGDFVWDSPELLAKAAGILPEGVNTASFMRSDVVLVSWAALNAGLKGGSQTLAEKLAADGVFAKSDYEGAGMTVDAAAAAPVRVSTSEALTAALSGNAKSIYIAAENQEPIFLDEDLTVPQGVTVTLGPDAQVSSFGTLTNNGTLRVLGSGDMSEGRNVYAMLKISGGGKLVNNGSIVLEPPTRLDIADELVLGGGLTVNESTVENNGSVFIKNCKNSALGGWVQVFMSTFTNNGLVVADSGDLSIYSPLEDYNSVFINNPGAVVINNARVYVRDYGRFTGSGVITGNPLERKDTEDFLLA